jgi:methylmalonyl-CoA/ethylmalonyl-CoA epimerase
VRIHHYGMATSDLARSADVFRLLGYDVSEPIVDSIQRVEVVFVSLGGEHLIELVCDSGEGGPTGGFLAKTGSGLYHICYEVDDIEQMIENLRGKRFLLRQKPVKATAFEGRKIAWLYNRDIGLIELLQK